jgi:hypothetical protein
MRTKSSGGGSGVFALRSAVIAVCSKAHSCWQARQPLKWAVNSFFVASSNSPLQYSGSRSMTSLQVIFHRHLLDAFGAQFVPSSGFSKPL